MKLMEIVKVPDERLRQKSSPIDCVDNSLKPLVDDMIYTMHRVGGIGLAAIQVGIPKRLMVIDVREDNSEPICIINPVILRFGDNTNTMQEGCLSIPECVVNMVRPSEVVLEYTTLSGEKVTCDASGILARVIQHEFDHLEGKLLLDHVVADNRQKPVQESELR
ncbi:peptide deformylase [Candidatus Sneabacter namystus]|uniref:Peptide deformylase n=1 Tax=Candidatus Sneabacter namystus TaxID=2601646 RepID=A0A5C0UJJ0_9RICK|nr:peptide deformylase [Candidatus Sneabacter namystus]QEK39642.1 peptide deformylase [Candidatus Sneabacter namystus]